MRRRSHVNSRKDKRIFAKTSKRMAKGNLPSSMMRGGLMK